MTAAGNWIMTMQTPMGEQKPEVTLGEDGTGSMKSPMGEVALYDVTVDGDAVSFASDMKGPMGEMTLVFTGTVDADDFTGSVTTPMGDQPVTGVRA